MQMDDPPYLSVGTAVSAKYKGAFCEAKVNKVERLVKCKVTYKMGMGGATVTDNDIKGTLRVGQHVQVKHPDKKELVEATITKIQDCSQYTVVFDDGDITTLRRTALCLKSGRHFNESETLDQLPLTHPEHFSTPVVAGRRGRRNRRDMKNDSSDEEIEEENNPDLERYNQDIGKVVSVESGEKKRGKESWFPGLVVVPSLQKSVNVKDEYLIRSFKDGRFYTVPKKETSEFNRELAQRVSDPPLVDAVQKAVRFLDYNELPQHWDKGSLFNTNNDSDDDENMSESSDDEPSEEKDRFVAQLYKFMDDSGTPLNKTPTVSNRDIDLHRLFRVVQKMAGYNRVTNHNKWRSVAIKLKLPNNQNVSNQVKTAYKKCLLSYESFHRTLGVTMLNPVRKKNNGNKGRSLIRDKDRNTPANSPRPEREDAFAVVEKIDIKKETPIEKVDPRAKKKVIEAKETKKSKSLPTAQEDASDTGTDTSDATASTSAAAVRPKWKERKIIVKDKSASEKAVMEKVVTEKVMPEKAVTQKVLEKVVTEKVVTEKPVAEKVVKVKSAEETPKKRELEKIEKPVVASSNKKEDKTSQRQLTRSKYQVSLKEKEGFTIVKPPKEVETTTAAAKPARKTSISTTTVVSAPPKVKDKEKEKEKEEDKEKEKKPSKIKKKLTTTSDKSSSESGSITDTGVSHSGPVNLGDKLHVFYGPTNESKVTYEAKVVDIDKDQTGPIYLVHYTGWNTRYDEWIPAIRIAENLSVNTKGAKRYKAINASQPNRPSTSIKESLFSKDPKDGPRRGRLSSVSSRAGASDQTPRSTTPSSVTSSGSQTKSPSTPATRSVRLAAKRDLAKKRRTSSQTDISVHSELESDLSESEPELPRTRSGSIKTEETDLKTSKPRVVRQLPRTDKRKVPEKEVEEPEKEEETEKKTPTKKLRKVKKPVEKLAPDDSEDDESSKEAKGRDFDLNQIRSELKGFNKAVKVPSTDNIERELSSSEDSNSTAPPSIEKLEDETPEVVLEPTPAKDTPKPPVLEKSSESSDDIYEFKEPEPFEFESRSLAEDKNIKKRLPRIFEELEKSPKSKLSKSILGDEPKSTITKAPERRTYGRAPRRRRDSDDSDDDLNEKLEVDELNNLDPFDKLVESPSFNLVNKISPDKGAEVKPLPPVKAIAEEPKINLFKEIPDNSDEYDRDNMELSDSESHNQIFTRKESPSSSNFAKSPPESSIIDMEFSSEKTDEGKTTNSASDEDDMIQAQIQRVIAQSSSTDDDSSDTLLPSSFTMKSIEEKQKESLSDILGITPNTVVETSKIADESAETENLKEFTSKESPEKPEEEKESKQISPALQETDSSLLESIVSKPPMILNPKVDDTGKELTVKTGTKIADSILQKFSFIKNNIEAYKDEEKPCSSKDVEVDDKADIKPKLDIKKDSAIIETLSRSEVKLKDDKVKTESTTPDKEIEGSKNPIEEQEPTKVEPIQEPERSPTPEIIDANIRPKRRRAISKPYVEESSGDSSDSEQLVIARSDDDEQSRNTNYPYKPSPQPLDRHKDDGHSSAKKPFTIELKKSEERNFKFDDTKPKCEKLKEEILTTPMEVEEEVVIESEKKEETKEELPDSRFDSLLFCEEELPRSPAPVPETSQQVEESGGISVHEIPFASAPGTSNSKIILEEKKHPVQPMHRPSLIMPVDKRVPDAQAVIENTPPTTPDTSTSNSPRQENDDISAANDSGKSNDGVDFSSHRRSMTNKVSPYSEEDTLMTGEMSSNKKLLDSFGPPVSCRKRRKSVRDEAPTAPVKRGRKPRLIRRDSDSDEVSENSTCGSNAGGNTPGSTTSYYDRSARSPRPSKYNFFVEFDPTLDSSQRIAVLQQKLSELRKTYADVKAELAAVERRRKRIRRREREALKMAKQEMSCA